jgi:hypothetical protein
VAAEALARCELDGDCVDWYVHRRDTNVNPDAATDPSVLAIDEVLTRHRLQ